MTKPTANTLSEECALIRGDILSDIERFEGMTDIDPIVTSMFVDLAVSLDAALALIAALADRRAA